MGVNLLFSKVWEEIIFEVMFYFLDYFLEKDKEWLMREGFDIEIKKFYG